jgi:hypothetical protein
MADSAYCQQVDPVPTEAPSDWKREARGNHNHCGLVTWSCDGMTYNCNVSITAFIMRLVAFENE